MVVFTPNAMEIKPSEKWTGSEMTSKKSDLLYITRGLGIIAVVMIHTYGSALFGIGIYALPLFFFVSGLTFRHIPFGTLLKKRALRLYVPFVIYELVFMILQPLMYRVGLASELKTSFMEYATELIHIALFDNVYLFLAPFWFATSLFFAQIIIYFIDMLLSGIAKIMPGRRADSDGKTAEFSVIGKWFKIVMGMIIGVILLEWGLWCGTSGWLRIDWSYNFKEAVGVTLQGAGYVLLGVSMKDLLFFRQAFGEEKRSPDQMPTEGTEYSAGSGGIRIHIWRLIALVGFAWLIYFTRLHNPVADMKGNLYDFRWLEPAFAMLGILGIIELAHLIQMLLGSTFIAWIFKSLGKVSFSIMVLNYPVIKLICLYQVLVLGMDGSGLSGWQVVDGSLKWQTIYFLGGLLIPAVAALIAGAVRGRIIKK